MGHRTNNRRRTSGTSWDILLRGASSAYAAYALALDFEGGEYWASGSRVGASDGPNLLTNGDGSNGIVGWTGSTGGVLSNVAGWLRVTVTGANEHAYQSFPTEVGKRYRFTYDARVVSGGALARIRIGTAPLSLDVVGGTEPGTGLTIDFVATATTTFLTLFPQADGAAAAEYDNLSVVLLAGVQNLPGYSYTRSGAKGERNALTSGDVIDDFAADVPGIVPGVGYWSRAAVTNRLLHSQAVDDAAWTKNLVSVTANAAVGPSGTVTMDKIIEGAGINPRSIFQTVTDAGAATVSAVMKDAGRRYVYFRLYAAPSDYRIFLFDLQTGTALGSSGAGASFTSAAIAMVDYGNGLWRCIANYTRASGTTYVCLNLSDTATLAPDAAGDHTYTGDGVSGVLVEHFQHLNGTFPDGGPVIATAGATASVGADLLAANVNPVTSDVDHIWWGVGNFKGQQGTFEMIATIGAGGYLARAPSGAFQACAVTGPVSDTGQSLLGAGRAVIMYRRRAGKDTAFTKVNAGAAAKGPEVSTSFGTPNSTVLVGQFTSGQYPLNGTVEGVFTRIGTFSDAECLAIVGAA